VAERLPNKHKFKPQYCQTTTTREQVHMKNNIIIAIEFSNNCYLPAGRSSTFAGSFSSIPGIPASPTRLICSAQITKRYNSIFFLWKK
jgi:hypothetical protein